MAMSGGHAPDTARRDLLVVGPKALRMNIARVIGPTLPQALTFMESAGNPLVDAVEQIGLELEPRREPVEVIVVDEARRVPLRTDIREGTSLRRLTRARRPAPGWTGSLPAGL